MPAEVLTEADSPSMDSVASSFQASLDANKPISEMAQPASDAVKAQADTVQKEVEAKTAPKQTEAAKETPKETAKTAKDTAVSKLMGKKEKAAETKVEEKTDTTTTEKPIDWKTAPKEFRERHEKLLTEHKTVAQKAQEYEKRVSEYEAKIKEIESKSGDTSKADLKLVEEYTKKIADYEARIRATDYSQSQEFLTLKEDFTKKYTQRYIQAADDVKQFQVKTGVDEAGNPILRTATDADLADLVNRPIGQQRQIARDKFGQDADVVIRHLERLKELRDDANLTLSSKLEEAKTQGELRTKEQRLAEQKQQSEYQQMVENFRKEIEDEWPDYFTEPKDDPEGAEALKNGKALVDAAINKIGAMTPQDRAAHSVVLQMRAAAFPLLEHKVGKLTAQVESLTKELEGVRGSDPGNGGAKSHPKAKEEDDVLGIEAMAKKILDPV